MNNLMNKFLKSSLWSSIGLVILGILLVFQSELTIVSISYVIGGILIAIGVIALIKYINNINKNIKNELDIIYGIGTIILGIIVISNPKAIASIIPFVLGILMVISSATKIEYSIELKKANSNLWLSTLIVSIITLVCGILLIFNPFAGAEFIIKVIGIILLVYGILDIISTLRINKTIKELHPENIKNKKIEDEVVEAEVIEDNTTNNKKKKNKEKKSE
ncbi:MAG: DUF308 domain-containing protein [Bacilli bacterium]|nr:DUF308 domain-containing protein [Bacilli bacterium]